MSMIIRKLAQAAWKRVFGGQGRAATLGQDLDAFESGDIPGSARSRAMVRRHYDREFIRDCLQPRFY